MKIVELSHNLKHGGEIVGTFRIYMKGSGNPAEEHGIVGMSIDQYGFGYIPDPAEISDYFNEEDLVLR